MTALEKQKEEYLYLAKGDISEAEKMGKISISEYIRVINFLKKQPKKKNDG